MPASPLITIMTNAAVKASKGLLRDFGEVDKLQISRKGVANFVTKADLRAEKALMHELGTARPDYGFITEESGVIAGKDPNFNWVIDPIDGTNNFIHALPYFCISLALEQQVKPGVKEIVAALIYDPIHNEIFSAEKGKGALANDRRLHVSKREHWEEIMIGTGTPNIARDVERTVSWIHAIGASAACVRSTGSAALDLAYVAAGRLDACAYAVLKPWDIAAGLLLVKEAGGVLLDTDGAPATHYSTGIVAMSRAVSPQLTKLLAVTRRAG